MLETKTSRPTVFAVVKYEIVLNTPTLRRVTSTDVLYACFPAAVRVRVCVYANGALQQTVPVPVEKNRYASTPAVVFRRYSIPTVAVIGRVPSSTCAPFGSDGQRADPKTRATRAASRRSRRTRYRRRIRRAIFHIILTPDCRDRK